MNSNINDEYHKMLNDMDANIKDADDLAYAKNKMYELSMLFIDEMQEMADKYDDKINAIIQKQQKMDTKIKEVEHSIKEIQQDVYDIDDATGNEVFEFEITCPYCNYVFEAEVGEDKKEVQCPECENLIELDWEGLEEDGYCGGGCHSCGDDCDCDDCNCEDDEDEDM